MSNAHRAEGILQASELLNDLDIRHDAFDLIEVARYLQQDD